MARKLRCRSKSPRTSSRSRECISTPPNTAGQYDLRLRSQLMPPPMDTVFLLVPAAPLTPDDPGRTRDIPLHRLVTSLQLPSHAYVGFVSLPEAIFHANHTIRYPASVRAVRMDSQSIRFCVLSTVGSCSLHEIDGTARPVDMRYPWGSWYITLMAALEHYPSYLRRMNSRRRTSRSLLRDGYPRIPRCRDPQRKTPMR